MVHGEVRASFNDLSYVIDPARDVHDYTQPFYDVLNIADRNVTGMVMAPQLVNGP